MAAAVADSANTHLTNKQRAMLGELLKSPGYTPAELREVMLHDYNVEAKGHAPLLRHTMGRGLLENDEGLLFITPAGRAALELADRGAADNDDDLTPAPQPTQKPAVRPAAPLKALDVTPIPTPTPTPTPTPGTAAPRGFKLDRLLPLRPEFAAQEARALAEALAGDASSEEVMNLLNELAGYAEFTAAARRCS